MPVTTVEPRRVASSFRDPAGFVFEADGVIHRHVDTAGARDYDQLVESGLYDHLTSRGMLVAHDEVDVDVSPYPERAHRVLQPTRIPFISHPYEWAPGFLRDAALLTLDAQLAALDHGMTLKDASAFNVQLHEGRPVLIDTLSFEKWEEGAPWVGYRQFCEHFLAPLALIHYHDVRLLRLWRSSVHGIPLDLASRLLPTRTWFKPGLLTHLHLHAKWQSKSAAVTDSARLQGRVSEAGLRGMLGSLRSTVKRLEWRPGGSEWANYYEETNYSQEGTRSKGDLVASMLNETPEGVVWDLGANRGDYSRRAVEEGRFVVSFDIDTSAVEYNYRRVAAESDAHLVPLQLDLTDPSPATGWSSDERESLESRGPATTLLALALVHHLAISNNVPLDRIARYFARLGRYLIIEFVPKSDSQVERLLSTREDIFPDYTQSAFERSFGEYFEIQRSEAVPDSDRTLYLMKRSFEEVEA